MKRVLHLVSVKNITFKPSYNWFKIDILILILISFIDASMMINTVQWWSHLPHSSQWSRPSLKQLKRHREVALKKVALKKVAPELMEEKGRGPPR